MEIKQNDLVELIFQEKYDDVKTMLGTSINVDYVDSRENTPLLTAIETANHELVKLLLDSGANPNLDTDYASPLTAAIDVSMEAFKNSGLPAPPIDIINLLVTYGADIWKLNKNGQSAYSFAKDYHIPAQRLFDELNNK